VSLAVEEIELKLIAEAVLFSSDRPVELRVLQKAMQTRSQTKARETLGKLMAEYNDKSRAVEVVQLKGDRFFMRLRPDLVDVARKVSRKQVLTAGVLKTLSFIAYHQPVSRVTVVAVRGKDAYRQIKMLVDRGLIDMEKTGRNQVLRTTQLFADLFGVENTPQAIKAVIRGMMSDSPLATKL